jgi:hypothetical protein
LLLILPGTAIAQARATVPITDASLYDALHPKYFVSVFETPPARVNKHDSLSVYASVPSGRGGRSIVEIVDAEVDLASRVHVAFDRPYLLDHRDRFDGDISVTGTITHGETTRPIEIPGYSMIGQAKQAVSVQIHSANRLLNMLKELGQSSRRVTDLLRSSRSTPSGKAVSDTAYQRVSTTFDSLQGQLRKLDVQRDGEYLAAVTDRSSALAAASNKEDSTAAIDRFDQASQRILYKYEPLYLSIRHMMEQIADTQDSLLAGNKPLRDAVTIVDVSHLLDYRSQMEVPLREVADTLNRTLIDVLAQNIGRDPTVLTSSASDALRLWLPLLDSLNRLLPGLKSKPDSAALVLNREYDVVSQLQDILVTFADVVNKTDPRVMDSVTVALARDFIGYLKDTEFLVSQTGAEDGDQIIVVISNNAANASARRDLTIRMQVRRFGFTRRVTDSFLLVKRIGVSSSDSTSQPASTQAASSEKPTSVNFQPVPGVTLGWTYFPARRVGFKGTISRVLRALHPGIGVNVSFPRFGSTITTFAPTDPNNPNSEPTAVVTQSANRIDVSVGPIVSVFDNAIQLSYGWDLTVSGKRAYWALGFSFVKFLQGAAEAVK